MKHVLISLEEAIENINKKDYCTVQIIKLQKANDIL